MDFALCTELPVTPKQKNVPSPKQMRVIMSLQEAASQGGRRATKFCPANVQKIKDWVAEGISREEMAERLDVTLGSLQVTCSRLGISLRRRHVVNGNASHSRVMNGNGTRHDLPNHPTMVARKRANGLQVT